MAAQNPPKQPSLAEPQRLDAAHRGAWHPGKQSSRSFPLSSWIFPPLSSAPLVPSFSLSVSLPPPPPRLLLLLRRPRVLAQLHLEPFSSYLASTSASLLRDGTTTSSSLPPSRVLSLLVLFLYFHPVLPALLFSPGRLPSSSSVSVSPKSPARPDHPRMRIIRDGLLFSSPFPSRLRLATCYPDCLRYEAQHTATWKEPRARGEAVRGRGRRGGREGR